METTVETKEVTQASIMVKITKNQGWFQDLYFVCSARSNDPSRFPFQYLKAEKGEFTCTDGKRLHTCKDLPEWDGFYEVIKQTKSEIILFKATEEIKFPDFKSLFNENPPAKECDINGDLDFNFAKVIRMAENATINHHFLEDLSDFPYHVKYWDDSHAIEFNGGNRRALVMMIKPT